MADLGRSLAVWRRHPMLPLTTLAVAGLSATPVDANGWIVTLIATLFVFGFVGTQRVWYLRAFRGLSMRPREVWGLTWRFVGRFLFLLILVTVPLGAVFAFVSWLSGPTLSNAGATLLVAPILVIGEVLATFVTPALSYATRSVRTAIRDGLAMLRSEWPACLWYALAPPVAAGAVGFGLLEPVVGVKVAAAISLTIGNLLNLWFKGAIALFYLRRNRWVGDDGSARA